MLELPQKLRQFEVAELLGITKTSVQRFAKQGLLKPQRDGRKVFYRREEVVGLFETRSNLYGSPENSPQ